MAIQFTFNAEKAEQAIVWLAENCPNLTKHKLSKLLFFADKKHLNKYGRPIIGDMYAAMKFGPVPSSVYSMLCGELPKQDDLEFDFTVNGNNVLPREDHNIKFNLLSGSDLEELSSAVDKYGKLSFTAITDISHKEDAWRKASHWMDYSDFIDDGEHKQAIIEDLQEMAETIIV